MTDKCKVHDDKISPCDALSRIMEYGNPTPRSKGVFIPERVNIKTHEPGIDICQIHSGQYVGRGAAMLYCPFCGESLKTW